MKRSIKDLLPRNAVNLGSLENFDSRRLSATRPYSQEGEDMILSYIFMQKGQQVFMWMLELTIQNAFQILIFSMEEDREA